jgi:predicted alpha-1,6-mannanase (GH76 family)
MTSGYVNAISNELFFSPAAHLANRAYRSYYYAAWAESTLTWFEESGMINSKGTINDGLDGNCRNNNGTVWSYNQGVVLGGLVEMERFAPGSRLYYHLNLAMGIARCAMNALTDFFSIIHDVCEDDNCGADGSQFKGIFIRNLAELWKLDRTAGSDFWEPIGGNAWSIWNDDSQVDGHGRVLFGVNWDRFVGIANASTHSCAMDALVADLMIHKSRTDGWRK